MNGLRFAHIELRNWKNFPKANVALASRVFIVGPNASGKSNFLDAFRFLRDLVLEGGGLRKAVDLREGLPRLRSLFARGANTEVALCARVIGANGEGWVYDLAFTHRGTLSKSAKDQTPIIRYERVDRVEQDGTVRRLLDRPDPDTDKKDPTLLTQTAIQQVTQNKDFRPLVDFFREVLYLHLVPQLVREGQSPLPDRIGLDQYGRDLLDRIRNTPDRTRNARLNRIQKVLTIVAAPLEDLRFTEDNHGRPHLQVKFRHWRPQGAYQNETQLSDGTLRLIGLLWSLQEKSGPLLLEEPELSLHPAVVKRLAPFIHRAQRVGNGRQVILSTHSDDLLMDQGIAPEEVLLVRPTNEGSEVVVGASLRDVSRLMSAGIPASEAVLPLTNMSQLSLFETVVI
jgi:predicted ATPase